MSKNPKLYVGKCDKCQREIRIPVAPIADFLPKMIRKRCTCDRTIKTYPRQRKDEIRE